MTAPERAALDALTDARLSRIRFCDETTCWLWEGSRDGNGYGIVALGKKDKAIAHRWVYEQVVEPIPAGHSLRRLCDANNCVNPDHLQIGQGSHIPRPIGERFWEKVDRSADCWLWTSGVDRCGYGAFSIGRGASPVRAHRFAYELLVGPIPTGLTLDHLCRVTHCVNPDHLEPVTRAENARRAAISRRLERVQ